MKDRQFFLLKESIMKKPRKTSKSAKRTRTGRRITARSRNARIEAAIFAKTAAAGPKGCCVIAQPGVGNRHISGLTKAECNAIQGSHPGTVTHWIAGSCA